MDGDFHANDAILKFTLIPRGGDSNSGRQQTASRGENLGSLSDSRSAYRREYSTFRG
jgi:hypothetical protein